ncbi:MAG TPA: hypothetical protein DEP72_03880 [Clostridiales bacterium]|nr:MAG: hypothetical protein A2Y18_04155 [Clostridiales bacterium GWD2_32_19]HCC07286.1 hypothetical protein [Clostridiales bacterium]
MKKVKIFIINIMFLLLFINVSFADQRTEYGKPIVTYETPMGVKFVSFSKNWGTKEKLEKIYIEFSKNFMSDEISFLNTVYFYPDTPEGVAGLYKPSIQVDSKNNYTYLRNNYIEIFDMNSYTQLSEVAKVLSHEYGHHFTMYYLVTKENKYFSEWKETGYSKARGLTKFSKIKYYDDLYQDSYEHKWDVTEVAAEDYVQLFGSPLAKRSVDYMDVKDRIINNISDYRYASNIFNLLPQENLDIPLAIEVNGLKQYWLGLAGFSLGQPTLPNRPKLQLAEEKTLLSKYKSYKIIWDEVKDNRKYEYNLVMYPEGDNSFPVPIKTTKTGEEMSAYLGSYMMEQPNGGARVIMENYKGKYLIRLFIKDEDNFMFSSYEYKIDFSAAKNGSIQQVYSANNGEIYGNENSIFSDTKTTHWAYKYITQLVAIGTIKGYSDGTYKPESSITKAEYLALGLRILKVNLTSYKQANSTNWFIRDGYLGAAKDIGLITEKDYGVGYKNLNIDGKISREEMAFITARAIVYKKGTQSNVDNFSTVFNDASKIKYVNELNIAVKYDIISGYPDKTFRPANTATRAEASKMISKLKAVVG